MRKQEPVYEGVSRKVYTTEKEGVYFQEFTNASAGPDGLTPVEIERKGACNNLISAAAFSLLEQNDIPTHFLETSGHEAMLVRRLKLIPLDVVCRNAAAGDFSKRLGLPDGEVLPFCVVEFHLRTGALSAPGVNAKLMGIETKITEGEVSVLRARALETNAILNKWFDDRELVLVDFTLEFGVDDMGEIRVGGEISLDTCRLWDRAEHEKLDRDRFRRDLGGTPQEYIEVLRRVSGKTGQT